MLHILAYLYPFPLLVALKYNKRSKLQTLIPLTFQVEWVAKIRKSEIFIQSKNQYKTVFKKIYLASCSKQEKQT